YRAGRELSVKAQHTIDIRVHIQPQTISHTGKLDVGKRWIWRLGGLSQDGIESQAEIAAESKRSQFQHLLLDFLKARFDWRRLTLRLSSRIRFRAFWFVTRSGNSGAAE